MIEVGNAQLHTGDVLDVLSQLPSASVHVCCTSVPYYGLRSYLPDGHPDKAAEIGLEETPEQWLERLVCVFREVGRVMRKDGTLWLNCGDSYAGSSISGGDQKKRVGGGTSMLQQLNGNVKPHPIAGGYKPKDLMMMPARLALALQADGWWLRSEIVWAKLSPMPESVTDRPTCAHEKIYLFSQAERYYYDADAVRERYAPATFARADDSQVTTSCVERPVSFKRTIKHSGRNMWNYWLLSSEPFPGAHFATYPTEIPKRAILAGTSEKGCCPVCGAGWKMALEVRADYPRGSYHKHEQDGQAYGLRQQGAGPKSNIGPRHVQTGWQPSCHCSHTADEIVPATVLDPFSGAGTTGLVALRLGRKYVGIDINEEYNCMAAERLRPAAAQGLLPL